MPECEICGKHARRRIRRSGKLICNFCNWGLNQTKEFLAKEYSRHINEISELRREIHKIRVKPRLTPYIAIPPIYVLKKAIAALELSGNYSGFSEVLANHFGIEAPPYYHVPERVPKGAVACYVPSKNTVYSKNPLSRKTAFHEFWHALESNGVAVMEHKHSESNADQFAYGCLKVLE